MVPLHRVSPFALIVILKFTPLFNFVSYEEVQTCFCENDCPRKNWEDRYSYWYVVSSGQVRLRDRPWASILN